MDPFKIIWQTCKSWWEELFSWVLLTAVWVVSFFLVIPVIPVTAVFSEMAHKTAQGIYWDHKQIWPSFKRLFKPAWLWGLPNVIFGVGMAFNFLTFSNVETGVWPILRVVWLVLTAVWFTANLFYWPFWFRLEEKSITLTYWHVGRFCLAHPITLTVLTIACGLVLLLCRWLQVPFFLGALGWIALAGETAVYIYTTPDKKKRKR